MPELTQKYKICENPWCERLATADDCCLIHERRDEKSKVELAETGLISNSKSSKYSSESIESAIKNFRGAYLVGAELSKTDIQRVDLTEADLRSADLSNTNISEGYFWEADLQSAVLSNTNIPGGYFREADLSHADLQNANLSDARLPDVNLSNADLREADFSDSDLRLADFSDSNLRGANFSGAYFREANLSNTNLRETNFSDADPWMTDFSNADLRGTDFSNAHLRSPDFSDVDLSSTDLSCVDFSGATLMRADLSHTNLSCADLRHADLRGADLRGADFSHSNLKKANFVGAKFSEIVHPRHSANAEFADADLSDIDILFRYDSEDHKQQRRVLSLQGFLVALLRSDDPQTIDCGLRAVGEISDSHPEICTESVEPIYQAIATTGSIVGKVSGLRALAAVALETDTSVDAADETFADCLRAKDDYLRAEAVEALAPVVGEHPTEYPETIRALRECATDGPPKETVPALQALAVVSATCPEDVPADEFETAVNRLSGDPRVPDSTVTDLQTALRGVKQ